MKCSTTTQELQGCIKEPHGRTKRVQLRLQYVPGTPQPPPPGEKEKGKEKRAIMRHALYQPRKTPTVTDPDPSRAQPKRKLFSKTCVRLCRGSKNNESDGYWGLIDGIRLILLHVLFSTIQSTRLSPRDGDFGLCSRERGGGGCPSESKAVLERSSICFLFFFFGGGELLFPRQGGKPDQIKSLGRSLLHAELTPVPLAIIVIRTRDTPTARRYETPTFQKAGSLFLIL